MNILNNYEPLCCVFFCTNFCGKVKTEMGYSADWTTKIKCRADSLLISKSKRITSKFGYLKVDNYKSILKLPIENVDRQIWRFRNHNYDYLLWVSKRDFKKWLGWGGGEESSIFEEK